MPTQRRTISRRNFLQAAATGAGGLAALLAPRLCRAASKAAKGKPNVILFFTDDQGSIDVNCYGAKDLHTPHMDDLAKRGVRFTQFYVGAPVCSPSASCWGSWRPVWDPF